ncbi:MAG TPA: VTT domain-containing protein [Burkholderiales bacterium]|nr:VTT domain-containing protein [Burkholderiales bacterium]
MGSVLYLHRNTQLQKQDRRDTSYRPKSLLRPGYNCYAVARAERFAILVDAADYFKAFYEAALLARRSITILGWDFNSQTRLHFDPVPKDGPPALVGDFLNYLVRRRRGLHVRILNWDYPMVFGADREFPPLYGFGWKPARRVVLRYDDTHPVAGCQHQKIVVIDDAIAFAGGIDLTVRRWDCSEHRPDDPRRVAYGKPYPPFHDCMVAVDGEAARALAQITRDRWQLATGQTLRPAQGAKVADGDPWPENLRPDLRGIDVGISRTMPPRGEAGAVREIERLYLDMIAAARDTIYIENQYFTAPRIAAAIEKRLAEPDGPEVVLVLRLLSHGWLEEATMHVLRTRLLQRLRDADKYGRFHVYFPHIEGLPDSCCIDVHSKLMVADDRWLRIGSANLCNRSMAMDTECDTLIESRDDPKIGQVIRDFRDRLIAEHVGVPLEVFQRKVFETQRLHLAIEALNGEKRALRPLQETKEWPEAIVEIASVADPEEPIALNYLYADRTHEADPEKEKPAWAKLALIVAGIAALTALWKFTPLADVVNAAAAIEWAKEFGSRWWAPLVVMLAYTPACFVMFPRPLITLAGVIAFGPWLGFVYALTGIVFSAVVTYFVGKRMKRDTVRKLAGPKLDRMVDVLKKHGLLAMTLLRLVPIAPFAVEGIVAGAVRLKLWHLAVGTGIGMLPGSLVTTIFGDQIETAASGGDINWWLVGGCAAALVGGAYAVKRWFSKMAGRMDGARPPSESPVHTR